MWYNNTLIQIKLKKIKYKIKLSFLFLSTSHTTFIKELKKLQKKTHAVGNFHGNKVMKFYKSRSVSIAVGSFQNLRGQIHTVYYVCFSFYPLYYNSKLGRRGVSSTLPPPPPLNLFWPVLIYTCLPYETKKITRGCKQKPQVDQQLWCSWQLKKQY